MSDDNSTGRIMPLKGTDFLDVDFLVGVAVLTWALLALLVDAAEPLNELVDYKAAFAVATANFTRWFYELRKRESTGE